MQTTDPIHTYAPIGSARPEPYPDGFVPDPRRWSGLEYARIATRPDAEPSMFGDDAPPGDPAPADARVTSARNATMVRYIAADRLPARQLVELRHVTDDPGRLALIGERLFGAVPLTPGAATDADTWTSPEPRLYEVRVGAILVAIDRATHQPVTDESEKSDDDNAPALSTRHVRAWRVPPAGPPMLVYETEDPQGDEHLVRLSELLDEPLETAFLALVDRYASSRPAPPDHRVLQLRSAIERWRFADEIAKHSQQPAGNRRRRRRGGRKNRAKTAQAPPRPANLVRTRPAAAA